MNDITNEILKKNTFSRTLVAGEGEQFSTCPECGRQVVIHNKFEKRQCKCGHIIDLTDTTMRRTVCPICAETTCICGEKETETIESDRGTTGSDRGELIRQIQISCCAKCESLVTCGNWKNPTISYINDTPVCGKLIVKGDKVMSKNKKSSKSVKSLNEALKESQKQIDALKALLEKAATPAAAAPVVPAEQAQEEAAKEEVKTYRKVIGGENDLSISVKTKDGNMVPIYGKFHSADMFSKRFKVLGLDNKMRVVALESVAEENQELVKRMANAWFEKQQNAYEADLYS